VEFQITGNPGDPPESEKFSVGEGQEKRRVWIPVITKTEYVPVQHGVTRVGLSHSEQIGRIQTQDIK
jgi:hypothetical protein